HHHRQRNDDDTLIPGITVRLSAGAEPPPPGPHGQRVAAGIRNRHSPAYPSATSKRPHPTPTPGPPCATTEDASPWTATPPTSSPPSWPAPPAEHPGDGLRAQPVRFARRPELSFCADRCQSGPMTQ